jgi:hypothetical protein
VANKTVIGIAQSVPQANAIVRDLEVAGFTDGDISVLLPDKNVARDLGHEAHTKAPEGAAAGAGAGGLLGGAIGLLAGTGTFAMPGLALFVAAGPILATLGGLGAGAAIGGVTGALVGAGIPEYEAKFYEGKIPSGNILIAVHTERNEDRFAATEILERAQASDISVVTEARVDDGHGGIA